MKGQPVIVFDGVCNLCNAAVRFIIRRDPKAVFKFASLQSPAGQSLLQQCGLSSQCRETILLVMEGSCSLKSSAVLKIAKHLSGLWPLFRVLYIIPRPLRDWLYEVIARNRYKWFGRQDVCMIPGAGERDRFLK